MDKDLQKSLMDTIQILVDEVIKRTPYTSSHVGKVKEMNGLDCVVEIYGEDKDCKLLEHLQSDIKVGDIVIVQDLYNDSMQRFIQAKIGETTS